MNQSGSRTALGLTPGTPKTSTGRTWPCRHHVQPWMRRTFPKACGVSGTSHFWRIPADDRTNLEQPLVAHFVSLEKKKLTPSSGSGVVSGFQRRVKKNDIQVSCRLY